MQGRSAPALAHSRGGQQSSGGVGPLSALPCSFPGAAVYSLPVVLVRSAPSLAHSCGALQSSADAGQLSARPRSFRVRSLQPSVDVGPLSAHLRSFRCALFGYPVSLTPDWLFLIRDEDYRGMTKGVVAAGF
jgi:hypothetical protein